MRLRRKGRGEGAIVDGSGAGRERGWETAGVEGGEGTDRARWGRGGGMAARVLGFRGQGNVAAGAEVSVEVWHGGLQGRDA